MVLPRSLVLAMDQVTNAVWKITAELLTERGLPLTATLPADLNEDERERMRASVRLFTDTEVQTWVKWGQNGFPELVPEQSMQEVMDNLGIRLPDDYTDNLPAASEGLGKGDSVSEMPTDSSERLGMESDQVVHDADELILSLVGPAPASKSDGPSPRKQRTVGKQNVSKTRSENQHGSADTAQAQIAYTLAEQLYGQTLDSLDIEMRGKLWGVAKEVLDTGRRNDR